MTLHRMLQAGLRRAVARGFGHADAAGRPVQAAALPWRRQGDGSIEILLVTGRGRGRWIVPKGWPMRGRSLAQAAAQEGWEEAGVRGTIGEASLGRFRHAKTHPLLGRLEFRVLLFPLAVETEATDWPERGERRRCWLERGAAARAVAYPALAKLVRRFAP